MISYICLAVLLASLVASAEAQKPGSAVYFSQKDCTGDIVYSAQCELDVCYQSSDFSMVFKVENNVMGQYGYQSDKCEGEVDYRDWGTVGKCAPIANDLGLMIYEAKKSVSSHFVELLSFLDDECTTPMMTLRTRINSCIDSQRAKVINETTFNWLHYMTKDCSDKPTNAEYSMNKCVGGMMLKKIQF